MPSRHLGCRDGGHRRSESMSCPAPWQSPPPPKAVAPLRGGDSRRGTRPPRCSAVLARLGYRKVPPPERSPGGSGHGPPDPLLVVANGLVEEGWQRTCKTR